MDEILIARLLFASTASVHYLFVAITLGLTPIIAVILSMNAVKGQTFRRGSAADILIRIYIANYGIGIVAGLVMELQMAMLWTGPGTDDYSPIAGLLALETVVAFFLESTLLGLWLAGRRILPAWAQAIIFWGITITAYASAVFIVTANAYLHNPIVTPILTPEAFFTLLLRPATLYPLIHIASGAMIVGAFWCATVGAIYLRRDSQHRVGRRLVCMGVSIAMGFTPPLLFSGFFQFAVVRPEGAETSEPGVAGVLVGLMVLGGFLIFASTWLVMAPLTFTGRIFSSPPMLACLRIGLCLPMPLLLAGWIYRELSRQPWFIVGRVTVEEAASPIGAPALLISAIVFTSLSALTLGLAVVVFRRVVRQRVEA